MRTDHDDDKTMTRDDTTDHEDERTVSESSGKHQTACECHETVDEDTRDDVLADYKHRCQTCGRYGPEKGGLATLHVHHIERDPDGLGEHDLENLTLLCRACHSWLHQQSTPDDAPVEITDDDQTVLLPQDIEILQFFADNGPARTGDIATGLSSDHSVSAVRERLWVLMGLDNLVDDRDRQIVDKDVETGQWGLVDQVDTSARGHIPDDPQLLLQRMEDERVRQALDRGCDRSAVMDALGVTRRTTFHKFKRGCAFDFPLDAFSRGGRPRADGQSDRSVAEAETAASESDEQQRLDAVADQEPASTSGTETVSESESDPGVKASVEGSEDNDRELNEDDADGELRAHLQQAISALQEVNAAL